MLSTTALACATSPPNADQAPVKPDTEVRVRIHMPKSKPSDKFKAGSGGGASPSRRGGAQLKEATPKKHKSAPGGKKPEPKKGAGGQGRSGDRGAKQSSRQSGQGSNTRRPGNSPDKRKGAGAKGRPSRTPGAAAGGGAVQNQRPGFAKKLFRKFFGRYVGGQKIQLKTSEGREAAEALGLSNFNLLILRGKYEDIDLDGSGEIDKDEFFDALNEQRSPFTDGLFRLIDADGSGTVDFDEYIRVLSTYCMYTKEDILKFCFDLFDVDGSGTIDEKEFVELVKCVNNASPMFPGNFGTAIQMFDVNDDGLIDFNEFVDIDRRFPLVLFPAFRLQDRMQKMTLGAAEWRSINEAVVRCNREQEYREKHNGREMPQPLLRKVAVKYFSCLVDNRKVDVERINASRPAAVMRAAEQAAQVIADV